jgi:hypothetical protein
MKKLIIAAFTLLPFISNAQQVSYTDTLTIKLTIFDAQNLLSSLKSSTGQYNLVEYLINNIGSQAQTQINQLQQHTQETAKSDSTDKVDKPKVVKKK